MGIPLADHPVPASPSPVVTAGPLEAAAKPGTALRHHFTVDVEEYFHVSAFEGIIPREHWEALESRAAASVARLLELLRAHDARATFFVLGWVAERNPALVESIQRGGHEIASHGWDHRRVTRQSPNQFRASIRRSKELLERLTGEEVVGFRAPSFSITAGHEWALDILVEEGYAYDSSLFPVRRPGYGYSGGERDPYWIRRGAGTLAEIPPATLRLGGENLPAAGGAYFRLLPYALTRGALRGAAARGQRATFYIHPWEIDPGQPAQAVSWQTRIRHYGGLARTEGRLQRLLSEFSFQSISDTMRRI
jgi:polysaccharide deacetylase family protein (PEP-CTERM system associated)